MPEQVNQYTPKDKITNSLTNPPRPKNLKRLVILWVILLISSFREKLCCQEPGLKSSSLRAPPSALCQKLVWNEFGMSLEMSSDQLRALHGLVFFGRAQIFCLQCNQMASNCKSFNYDNDDQHRVFTLHPASPSVGTSWQERFSWNIRLHRLHRLPWKKDFVFALGIGSCME